jgi:hypothetical protein
MSVVKATGDLEQGRQAYAAAYLAKHIAARQQPASRGRLALAA